MLKCFLKQPALRRGQVKGCSLPSQALTLQLLWPPPPTPTHHSGGARAKLCWDQAGCISCFPFAWTCPCFLVGSKCVGHHGVAAFPFAAGMADGKGGFNELLFPF